MIINGPALLASAPIKNMAQEKLRSHGVSYGATEAGYDIRIRQDITFTVKHYVSGTQRAIYSNGKWLADGRFVLASSMEVFQMPDNLVGVVHDKSTWARKGLSVFNTVIEPGWCGGLTLELVYHGEEELFIPAGAGIAQVLFSRVESPARYAGKYNHQSTDPVPAIFEIEE